MEREEVEASAQEYGVDAEVLLELREEWLSKKELIEAGISEVLDGLDDASFPEVSRYILAGGKRFRGFLTLLTAEALGGSVERALPAAVAIELVQAATLAIDDIIDGDEYRRGRLAAWMRYGLGRSVMASLLLIPLAQKLVESLGFKALYHVIRAWESTVRGEVLDSFLTDLVQPEKYLEVCRLKTGSLFRLATILGALAARAPEEAVKRLGDYGDLLGIIYQLSDDIADYTLYTRGDRGMEPGLRIFEKWAKAQGAATPEETVQVAIAHLKNLIRKAQELIDQTPGDPGKKRLLRAIPYFIAHKMLSTANLEHHL